MLKDWSSRFLHIDTFFVLDSDWILCFRTKAPIKLFLCLYALVLRDLYRDTRLLRDQRRLIRWINSLWRPVGEPRLVEILLFEEHVYLENGQSSVKKSASSVGL